MVCMWRRARGFRRGFTNHCDSADIIDDMVFGAAPGIPLFVLRGGGVMRLLPHLLGFVGEERVGGRDFGPGS
jgi:hypothetical protein